MSAKIQGVVRKNNSKYRQNGIFQSCQKSCNK